ncbi:MAG TPA: MFS transporter [Syntrophaceae bacterium]|nr:MFS transporter [Syntrophaceae bacterium]
MTDRHSREIFCWMLYDFANTAYTVIIVTFVYSVYFKNIVCEGLGNRGDLLWGISCALSMLVAATLSPLLGAIADHSHSKKGFLIWFSLLCIISSGLLSLVQKGMVFLGMFLFILANVGFQGGVVFYNAFLPELVPPDKMGRISGYGWAFGYLGAIFIIFISTPFLIDGWIPENLANIRFTFLLQAAFFAIFSLPAFIGLNQKRRKTPNTFNLGLIKMGFQRLCDTYNHIGRYKELLKFLIAYFVYMEGVTTIIYFSTIYASNTLGFTLKELVGFYVVVHTAGIMGAILFGRLADIILPKRTISITLIMWIIVTVGAYLAYVKAIFWSIGLLAGLAIGSSQAVSRSMMGLLTPKEKVTEFFGFYGVFTKSSAVIGPFVFGVVSALTQSQRFAIISVALFFIVGFILLQWVDEKKGYQL